MSYNGKTKPETQVYYNRALAVLKRDGYIKSTELMEIFNGMHKYSILLCFERNGEDLYHEKMLFPDIKKDGKKHGMKKIRIYRRLKPIHDKWKRDARTGLPKNGCIGPVGLNV